MTYTLTEEQADQVITVLESAGEAALVKELAFDFSNQWLRAEGGKHEWEAVSAFIQRLNILAVY